MAQFINEIKRMQQLAGLLKENKLNEAAPNLHVIKRNSEQGNKQITLSVLGGGFEDNQISLSVEEAKALQKLAKEFLGKRNNKISTGVNTPDKEHTQSTISIEPSGLECIISRKEGSIYKGYDEESGSNTGYLKAAQSIVYGIADEDLNESIKEDATSAPAPANAPAPKNAPSDVKALNKAQQASTSVQSKANAINNIQEFPGAFENWFKTLGFQPGKISKSAIRTEVEKVLSKLGYK